jgi:hypothetical protein
MSTITIQTFFEDFERNSNSGEMRALISQFADSFMVAGPRGTQTVDTATFALALPKRRKLFDDLGCHSTVLLSLQETRLDGRYVMVETQWGMKFGHGEASVEDIVVGSTFIVNTVDNQLKIVFYLSHQDIMTTLKDKGLL